VVLPITSYPPQKIRGPASAPLPNHKLMTIEKQSIFEFHTGFKLLYEDEQSVMDCPFCGSESKFYFNKEGLWDCKSGHCKKSGNAFTFIREIYDLFDTRTKAVDIIHELRKIPRDYIMRDGPKYNELNNSIIIPAFKYNKVQALYKAVSTQKFNNDTQTFEDKLIVYASPSDTGVEHAIMHWTDTLADIVWITEGFWDKLAAQAIVGHGHPISVLSAPGAGVWKPNWCELLTDKHVVFLYDNDTSGQIGFEKVIIKHIAQSPHKPKSIQYLGWPTNLPDGYDINELYLDAGKDAFDFIEANLKPYNTDEHNIVVKTIETVAPDFSCDSWDELTRRFRETYYVTPDMEMCLAAMLCALYSLQVDGEQLWYKIIGPPGCGKTTLAKMISACDLTVLRSIITGLFSGWKDESDDDASLAHTISNKCLCIKDADTLVKQPNATQIFAEFRDFYDKDSSTQYKNRIQHDYRNTRSSIILCGTNVLRRSDHSFLGERFLDYELHITPDDEREIKRAVRRNAVSKMMNPEAPSVDLALQASVKGFVEGHLLKKRVLEAPTLPQEEMIDDLATLVAQMRTDVDRDMGGKGEVTFNPVVEVPSRLLGQLIKVSTIMPVVTGDNRYREAIVKKFATDIIDPSCNRFKICRDLREGFMTRDGLVESTSIPRTTVTRILDDLRTLDLMEIRYATVGVGRKRMELTLKESVKDKMRILGF